MAIGESHVLSENDVRFVVETVATERSDYDHIIGLVRDKPDFLEAMLNDKKLLRRVIGEQDILLRISPRLMFDILVRAALRDMEKQPYTLERVGTEERIPVFDSQEVLDLMRDRQLRGYLSDTLVSFTKTESTTVYFKTRHGFRRRTYSDMDLDDMVHLAGLVDEEARLPFYKRIGDICLFITGIFPEHVSARYPVGLGTRPRVAGSRPRPLEDYEGYARRFYRLAAERAAGEASALESTLATLADHFGLARKPLNFISERYIKLHRTRLFSQGE